MTPLLFTKKTKMGCCHQNVRILTPPINLVSNYLTNEKLTLTKLVQIQVENFEKLVQTKIKPNKPKTATEISGVIELSMRKVVQDFENSVKYYNNEAQIENLIKTFKLYLVSKCKSKEGFFRNQNDYFSFKYIFNLIKFLLGKMKSEGFSVKDSIELYSKLARGAYMIMGLNEYNILLGLSDEEKEEYLKKLEEIEIEKLGLEKSELIDVASENWNHFNHKDNVEEANDSKILG